MMRLFSSLESLGLAAYFCATYVTPTNLRAAFSAASSLGARRMPSRLNVPVAVFVCTLFLAPTFAQTTASPAALSPDVIELRRDGNAALYNIDYPAARLKFEEIRRRVPQHPAGDLYLATLTWLEYLNKNRRLQTGLYSDESSFYAGAENAKEGNEGDAIDPATDRAFRDRMAQAKTKALALVARNKNDADALYFLGAYYGVMAGYEASTARKFFAAMRNGSNSVDAHQKVIKLRPDYYDAYLSIGMYDYIVGNLPFAYKTLAALAGVRGNKTRGIERLKTIIEKDAATADDARVMLLAIYKNEQRYNEALTMLQTLNAKYANSYLLKLETASTFIALNRSADAYQVFDALLLDPAAATAIDLVNYQYAEALASNHEFKRAVTRFLAVPLTRGGDPNLATLALLRAAQLYDQTGERTQAIAQYKAVLERANVYDTHEQATRGLKQPFKAKQGKEREAGS